MTQISAVTFDVVRPYDPAIVYTNSPRELGEFSTTRDLSALTLDAGVRPVVFRCRSLTREQRTHVRDQKDDHRQLRLAFRYGILEISDILREDGTFACYVPDRRHVNDAITPEMEDAIERYGFGDIDIADVGSVIVARSFLARGVPLRSELPASSAHACTLMFRLRAEQKRDAPTPGDAESK